MAWNLVHAYLIKNKMFGQVSRYWWREGDICPNCGFICADDSEYVDVGVGSVQVTYEMTCYVCGAEGHMTGEPGGTAWWMMNEDGTYRKLDDHSDEIGEIVGLFAQEG